MAIERAVVAPRRIPAAIAALSLALSLATASALVRDRAEEPAPPRGVEGRIVASLRRTNRADTDAARRLGHVAHLDYR